MFEPVAAFSGISVDDLAKAKDFYGKVLGLSVEQTEQGLQVKLPNGGTMFVYAKPNHEPASFTVLNFVVEDIDQAVDELEKRGVTFEVYDGMGQDEKHIARGLSHDMGPDIAWFTDPAKNILAVLQSK